MGAVKQDGLISRAVREALGTLVSPQKCEELIRRSLAAHKLDSIPEHGTIIGEWLEGSLRGEVEHVVGPDAADLVMSQLGPIAAYAAISQPKVAPAAAPRAPAPAPSREERWSDEPDRPTDLRMSPNETDWDPFTMDGPVTGRRGESRDEFMSLPPPPEPTDPFERTFEREERDSMAVLTLPPARAISDEARPANDVSLFTARPQGLSSPPEFDSLPHARATVLAATSDIGNLGALRRYLQHAADVVHIVDMVGLLDTLDHHTSGEPIVLIDCQRPTLHSNSVMALGEDLPQGTTIVLWGADEGLWQQIEQTKSQRCRWVRCSREASTSDVGSLCSMLIG
jgi:hypothetical protein